MSRIVKSAEFDPAEEVGENILEMLDEAEDQNLLVRVELLEREES